MKILPRILACLSASLVPAMAEPASKSGVKKSPAPAAAPQYQEESPLPQGWPRPGPFDQVVRKSYPAYRAAFTTRASPNGGFWTLFKHIERNRIPMTAPVEMKLRESPAGGVSMEEMGFLYQAPGVGHAGADGDQVMVRDMPAQEALSYAWQGTRNKAATARARNAIQAELARQNLTPAGFRLLAYNSPFIPRAKQTHELQALIPPPPTQPPNR